MHLLYDVVLYLSGDYAYFPLFVEQKTLHQANELRGTSTHLPSFQTQTPWLRCVSQMKIQFPSGIVLVSFVPPKWKRRNKAFAREHPRWMFVWPKPCNDCNRSLDRGDIIESTPASSESFGNQKKRSRGRLLFLYRLREEITWHN